MSLSQLRSVPLAAAPRRPSPLLIAQIVGYGFCVAMILYTVARHWPY
jgi:hypothetical protein